MNSLEGALQPLLNRELAVWLNHHDLKVLTGRLLEVHADHVLVRTGADQAYFIPYHAVVAFRPAQ